VKSMSKFELKFKKVTLPGLKQLGVELYVSEVVAEPFKVYQVARLEYAGNTWYITLTAYPILIKNSAIKGTRWSWCVEPNVFPYSYDFIRVLYNIALPKLHENIIIFLKYQGIIKGRESV